jgi:hypothetical protein
VIPTIHSTLPEQNFSAMTVSSLRLRLKGQRHHCIPAPFNGNLLQIMPWPGLKDMSDNDLRAIYEYLSTLPCVQGNYSLDPANRCG